VTWTRTAAVVGIVVALALAGCGTPDDGAGGAIGLPETRRGPVSLEGSEPALVLPHELSLDVPSCHGAPELTQLLEDPDTVRLEVVTTQVVRGDSDDCLDGLAVVLEEPLGERDVVDLVSGATLAVHDQTEVLECADLDYPGEPTFATPEEALADVLRGPLPSDAVPDRTDEYVRDDREGRVYFEHIVDDHDVLYTWGVAQDDDGRWGVVSLGGCF
jgi:hypothetical protein